jgi:hypothetical protein
MKKLLLAGISALLMTTSAHARNSDWPSLTAGWPSRISCSQFNALSKAQKKEAMAWALGWISGMATMNAEESKGTMHGEEFDRLIDALKVDEAKLVPAIKRACRERGDTAFRLVVEWTSTELK